MLLLLSLNKTIKEKIEDVSDDIDKFLIMAFIARFRERFPKKWIDGAAVEKMLPEKYQKYMNYILFGIDAKTPNVPGFTEGMMFTPPADFLLHLMSYCVGRPERPLTEASKNRLCGYFLENTRIYKYADGKCINSITGFQNSIYLIYNMYVTIDALGSIWYEKVGNKFFIQPIEYTVQSLILEMEGGKYTKNDGIVRISDTTGMIDVLYIHPANWIVRSIPIYYSERLQKWRFNKNDSTNLYNSLMDILVALKEIRIRFPVAPPVHYVSGTSDAKADYDVDPEVDEIIIA